MGTNGKPKTDNLDSLTSTFIAAVAGGNKQQEDKLSFGLARGFRTKDLEARRATTAIILVRAFQSPAASQAAKALLEEVERFDRENGFNPLMTESARVGVLACNMALKS